MFFLKTSIPERGSNPRSLNVRANLKTKTDEFFTVKLNQVKCQYPLNILLHVSKLQLSTVSNITHIGRL